MKRPIQKPAWHAWLSFILMFFLGLALGFQAGGAAPEPTAWEKAAGAISPTLMGVGIGGTIGLFLNLRRYKAQTSEERRDADLAEQDERNVAIQGQAAYASMNITSIALVVIALLACGFEQDLVMWLCVGLSAVQWVSFLIAVSRYEKRM